MATGVRTVANRIPPAALFMVGGASMYLGAALAVGLFRTVPPASVAWLRQLGAAVLLLAWRRPRSDAWRGRRLVRSTLFGLTTALMNIAFYAAIAQLPLGTTVAVEFVGPVVVAAIGSRSRRDWLALLAVALGVALIADVRWSGSPLGVLLALLAAAFWAGYIVLGKLVASGGNGVDDMAVGFAVATVLLSPLALDTGPVWGSAGLAVAGLGVGVLSTVVPYVLDQVVLRRVSRVSFARLLSLLPVMATALGLFTLSQIPGPIEALGILAVVTGLLVASRGQQNAQQDSKHDKAGPGERAGPAR